MEDEEWWVLPCWLKPNHTPSDLYLSEGLYRSILSCSSSLCSGLVKLSTFHFNDQASALLHYRGRSVSYNSKSSAETYWVGREDLSNEAVCAYGCFSACRVLLFKAPFIPNNHFFRQHHHSCVQIVSGRSLQLSNFSSRRNVVYRQPSHGVALIRIMRSLAMRSCGVQHAIISLFVWQADSH